MALLSKPDYVWRTDGYSGRWRVRVATGEIVARVTYSGSGAYSYRGADYIDVGSAMRACESQYPSGDQF